MCSVTLPEPPGTHMSAQPEFPGLENLKFDNRFVYELPADPEPANYRRQVSAACYSRVLPVASAAPEVVAYTPEVAALLDLKDADCETQAFAEVFAGNRLTDGMDPYATCYGGHQFGHDQCCADAVFVPHPIADAIAERLLVTEDVVGLGILDDGASHPLEPGQGANAPYFGLAGQGGD